MERRYLSLGALIVLSLLFPLHEAGAESGPTTTGLTKPPSANVSSWGRVLQDRSISKSLTDVAIKSPFNPNSLVVAVRSCSHLGDLRPVGGNYMKKSYCPLNLPVGARLRKITAYPRQSDTWDRYRDVMSHVSLSVIHVWRETITASATRVDEVPGIDEPGFLLGGQAFWMGRDTGSLAINYETEARLPQDAYYLTVDSNVALSVDPSESSDARFFLFKFDLEIQSMIGLVVVEYDPPVE